MNGSTSRLERPPRYGAHPLRYWEERGQAPDQPVTWRFSLEDVHSGGDIDLREPITRAQFEALIATETHRLETCLLDTLEGSGLAPDRGGTCRGTFGCAASGGGGIQLQLPAFRLEVSAYA